MSNQPFPEGPWSAYNARTFSPAQPEASLIEIGDENQARKETQAQGKERDTNGQRVIQIEKTDGRYSPLMLRDGQMVILTRPRATRYDTSAFTDCKKAFDVTK